MIDPWGLVIVLAIGCACLLWYCACLLRYGLRMGGRLHEAEAEIVFLRNQICSGATTSESAASVSASEASYSACRATTSAAAAPLATEYKQAHVAPDGTIWGYNPTIRYFGGLVAVAEGERVKAEAFGWEWAGWDAKSQRDLMRRG